MKEDLIELLKVKYGLFNVDEWKKILSDLIRKKVEEMNVTGGNREEMRAQVTTFPRQSINGPRSRSGRIGLDAGYDAQDARHLRRDPQIHSRHHRKSTRFPGKSGEPR